MEKTLIFIKPDGVKRGLVSDILGRFERRGFEISRLQMMNLTSSQVEKHYEEHVTKPFFPSLKEYVMSGPVVVAVLKGTKAVEVVRKMIGATDGAEADPGTIRGEYALTRAENLIHGSDSTTAAAREIAHFFG